jgi:hypothetical protein
MMKSEQNWRCNDGSRSLHRPGYRRVFGQAEVRDIVEAILGGRQPAGLQLDALMRRFPVGCREQQSEMFGRLP